MSDYKEIILINDAYLKSLLTAIEQATDSIDLEVYIFENDSIGQQITDALCRAANRNVTVRVLVDGVGSINWGNSITTQMENAGIQTKIFNPLPWKIFHWKRSNYSSNFFISKIIYLLSKINTRNHRKICIIDKHIVYTGSANISEQLKNWRETSVKLININTEEVQYAFDKAWGNIPLKKRLQRSFFKITSNSTFLLNYSWRRRHRLYKSLLNRISHCKKRIWVTNAYFVPDRHLLKKLINASRKGVDVKILLPEKSDVSIIPLTSAIFYSELLNSGAFIYHYTPTILHAKTLILDNWYSIGSSNLDYRSFKHNLEIDVKIQTSDAQEIIDKQFLLDLSQSSQLQKNDLKKQSLYKRLIGNLALLIKYWI